MNALVSSKIPGFRPVSSLTPNIGTARLEQEALKPGTVVKPGRHVPCNSLRASNLGKDDVQWVHGHAN